MFKAPDGGGIGAVIGDALTQPFQDHIGILEDVLGMLRQGARKVFGFGSCLLQMGIVGSPDLPQVQAQYAQADKGHEQDGLG
jgi:hypothetical protein